MAFQNSTGSWEHEGAFAVILIEGTPTHLVPPEASVINGVVRVSEGKVFQAMGGIQFYACDKYFTWGYSRIIGIFDGNWQPIWINHAYNQ